MKQRRQLKRVRQRRLCNFVLLASVFSPLLLQQVVRESSVDSLLPLLAAEEPRSASPVAQASSESPAANTSTPSIPEAPLISEIPTVNTFSTRRTQCPVNHCQSLGATAQEQYPNLIVLVHAGGAGLMDRLSLSRHVMNLGAMLCARVALPPPNKWLAKVHNRNKRIPKDLMWHDLITYPLLLPENELNRTNHHPRKVFSPMIVSSSTRNMAESFFQEMQQRYEGDTSRRFHLYQNDTQGTLTHFQHLYNMVENNKKGGQEQRNYFVWEMIPQHLWVFFRKSVQDQLSELRQSEIKASKSKAPSDATTTVVPLFTNKLNQDHCGSYVERKYSQSLISLAKLMLQEANKIVLGHNDDTSQDDAKPLLFFGFVHIRRGDSTGKCDSSLETMKGYLECSLTGPTVEAFFRRLKQASQPFVMFLATDERDSTYRESMLKLMEEQSDLIGLREEGKPPLTRAIDVDALILQVLEREIFSGNIPEGYNNNYSIFFIGKIMAQMGLFGLAKRRKYLCKKCNRDWVDVGLERIETEIQGSAGADEKEKLQSWVKWRDEQWDDLEFVDH
mmetsp:Transcript_6497/g.16671  ORF Transcript_6497/g.16671 Transcript_6497/m.16671 type:complete len:560 (-) Transcript_6497:3095-4774(-)